MLVKHLVTALAVVGLGGCMNVALSQAREDPGPHDSPLSVVALGTLGDAALAAMGAGLHASSDDDLAFEDVILYYAAPLLVVDFVVTVMRLKH